MTTTLSEHALERGEPRLRELDWLMLAVVALCCIGLTMAVSVQALRDNFSPLLAIRSQGAKLVVGLVLLLGCSLVPLRALQRLAWPLFGAAVLAVAATHLFDHQNGAHRWLKFGGTSVQPVEFARLALIVVTAATIARGAERLREFRGGFLRLMAPAALLAALLAKQPDLGNALLTLTIAVAMGLASGVRVRWFALAALPLIPAIVFAVATRGYALGRISSFMGDAPPYQVAQSLTAISAGGLTGAGIGNGWMKLGFVPEAHNDFVFAIIGEELGFAGSLLVLGLYTIIGAVGFRLVLSMRDPFNRYLVFGCTIAICMQAMINLLVTTGMAPAKGIDLPLISSGGTNLVATLAAVGLIGNAARTDSSVRT